MLQNRGRLICIILYMHSIIRDKFQHALNMILLHDEIPCNISAFCQISLIPGIETHFKTAKDNPNLVCLPRFL